MHKLHKNTPRKIKSTDLHYFNGKNHSDSKLCQKVIIPKVYENILYINYSLIMFKFWKLNAPI